jgi:CDP-glucose 4,6-dehydratase
LVRASYRQPLETFSTNIMGSAHLLDSIRGVEGIRVVVMVTTDKVYLNREWSWPYREDDPLGGHDPYSASKAASEIVIESYRQAFFRDRSVRIASARAGNVIGGGDWSEDRLLPDAVRAWQAGQTLTVRHPSAIRPWQHVLEPLAGYLRLAASLHEKPSLASSYNFGPYSDQSATVREVVTLAREAYGIGTVEYGGANGPHEAGLLALEIARARADLGFKPRWSLRQSVSRTMQWYRAQSEGASAFGLCAADIAEYEAGV